MLEPSTVFNKSPSIVARMFNGLAAPWAENRAGSVRLGRPRQAAGHGQPSLLLRDIYSATDDHTTQCGFRYVSVFLHPMPTQAAKIWSFVWPHGNICLLEHPAAWALQVDGTFCENPCILFFFLSWFCYLTTRHSVMSSHCFSCCAHVVPVSYLWNGNGRIWHLLGHIGL